MNIKLKKQTLVVSIVIVAIVLIGFFIVSVYTSQNQSTSAPTENINLWAILITGLLTGGLTCLAVQGGLLAASIAQREEQKLTERSNQSGNAVPILAFLVAKLIAYTTLGFLLGWFGSLFQLSLTAQIIMQVAVAVFMLGSAFDILKVHPVFRYFIIQPPKSLTRLVRNQSKSKSLFAPALLGAFTVFIPCGTTQAMMALAISSGSPLLGAAVLFTFVLGTSPLFFTLGYFATKLGKSLHQKFMKVAAVSLIVLAIFNLNNVFALTGSSWTLENIFKQSEKAKNTASNVAPQKNVVITVKETGYSPNIVTVKSGTDVSFQIKNDGVYTCASAFTIPAFNFQKVVQAGATETITLKMPDKPTQIAFMCSMGMYRGMINVI
jgi:sulfite exporter TauE/SafE